MNAHVWCSSYIGKTLLVCGRCARTSLIAMAALLLLMAGQSHAADMMLEWRNGQWMPIAPADIEHRSVPNLKPSYRLAPEPQHEKRSNSPSLAPAVPPEKPRAGEMTSKAQELAGVPHTGHGPRGGAEPPVSALKALSGFLWQAVPYGLWVVAGLLVLANLRGIFRSIDSVFEVAANEELAPGSRHELQTESAAAAMTFDLRDFVQSEVSAAEIRKQTEILRALKEELNMELNAVRAMIRRERAKTRQPQT